MTENTGAGCQSLKTRRLDESKVGSTVMGGVSGVSSGQIARSGDGVMVSMLVKRQHGVVVVQGGRRANLEWVGA